MKDTFTVTHHIIGAAIDVHRELGPGLLESTYEECMCAELRLRSLPFERQVALPVIYKGKPLDCGYRLDLIVEGVIVEIKAVERVLPVHQAQLLTYLKLKRLPLGLLINFHVATLRSGITRIVNGL